jgi:phosphodiesterase/alkaline phosphatase D-like protein
MSASSVSFAHGVASGDPYTDSVILWTRISPPDGQVGSLDVQWEIATSADFAPGSIKGSGSFSTSAARDWTVKVEAAGLSADTSYYYRFTSGNTVSTVGQTKTLPVGSDPVRLAVFSCSNFTAAQQFDAYTRAAAINSANPYDAWLHLGDYIYEYGVGGYGAAEDAAGSRGFLPDREILSLDDYRLRYAQYHTDAGLQALRAAAPLIAGWDDHETANNSWSGGAENHQSAIEGDWLTRRDAALKAYYEWVPIREPAQRQASDGASALSPLTQAYRSFNFGDVLSLNMLETRLTARDEQLAYPDAAAVQARIGDILANPALVASYATKAGIAPPASQAAIPAFANALAPLVTQELVLATVQQAWGDPNRDMIGDTQLAWLQQRLATSTAAWHVLGQQTLMQSMAVPAELLLNVGNLALLDKYAAPLQKLATGTPFANLSAAEQALFAEAGKIPYNLDAWDGYGVERETILQTAQSLGKRLISLAGDTHNAWAGLLDTMSAGTQPAGTVAGVEFATPGVTAPGFEKYLPGADAYIRAKYPAVDGLDALFQGYVNGLKYADLNRRGFLDLTVSKEQAVGTFQLLNSTDPLSGKPVWSSETVVSSASFALSTSAEARPLINWQPSWQELDLNFGLAFDAKGAPTLLDPAAYASVPRDGVQLADVRVLGSVGADRVVVGAGAIVETGAGGDELDNTDSLGGNVLAAGSGTDQFLLRAADDTVIGGELVANASSLGLPAVVGFVDNERDTFLIDSSNPAPAGRLRILDYELGIDRILLDGVTLQTPWPQIKSQLQSLSFDVNAAPQLSGTVSTFNLKRGLEVSQDLASFASDADTDSLTLIKLDGPTWITTSGTTLRATAPLTLNEQDLSNLNLKLAFSDGKVLVPFALPLALLNTAPTALSFSNALTSLSETSAPQAASRWRIW